jgi:hypothetical protein
MNSTAARTVSLAIAVMAAATALVAGAAPASAAPVRADTAPQSCWINVDTDASRCFDATLDPLEQIATDTGLPVIAVPTGAAARSAAPSPSAAAASYVLAVVYDGLSYTGASNTYFTTNSAICNGLSYGYASLGAWNDRIQSVDSYNGCLTTLYWDAGYGGAAYGPVGSSINIGNMRSNASSLRIE